MSTVARCLLLGLATLVLTLVAVGSVAVAEGPRWTSNALFLPPFVAGVAAAVAHPGPRVAGWVSFVVSVLAAPVLVLAVDEGLRIDAGAPSPGWFRYASYPLLALVGAGLVLLLRRRIRRSSEKAADGPV